jgi:hypothetical protein
MILGILTMSSAAIRRLVSPSWPTPPRAPGRLGAATKPTFAVGTLQREPPASGLGQRAGQGQADPVAGRSSVAADEYPLRVPGDARALVGDSVARPPGAARARTVTVPRPAVALLMRRAGPGGGDWPAKRNPATRLHQSGAQQFGISFLVSAIAI